MNIEITVGVIKQQAIKGTVIIYIAVIVGFINTAILLPKIDTEIVGLINILIAYTLIIRLIGGLGFGAVTSRLFAYFRNEKNNHNGFMFIAVSITIIGFILSVLAIFVLKYYLLKNRNHDDLFLKYLLYLIPLVFFTLTLNTLDDYYKVTYKAVRGIVLRELVQKIGALIAVFIYVIEIVNTNHFVLIYTVSYCIPGLLILLMIIYDKQFILKPQLQFVDKQLRNTMVSVALFGIATSAIGILTLNIDKIMLEAYLGLSYTGIYSVAFYFGTIIALPSRSLLKIATTVIAEAWKNNDFETIKIVAYKSSLNQFIIGCILFLGIIINLDNIFIILTNKYEEGRIVIIFIGLAFLVDMLSGASRLILTNSRYYKYGTYITVFYAILIVVTNFLFIPRFGIAGAAFATLLAKTINNALFIFTSNSLFKLQPFDSKFLIVLSISLSLFLLNFAIPKFQNYLIDILIRSSLIGMLYLIMIYILRISEDVNEQLISIKNKIIKSIKTF